MDHEKLRILLSLMSSDSDFQVAQGRAAQKAAAAHGFAIDVVFAENDAINQNQQLLKAIQAAPQMRPDVVILQPVGTGLVHVALWFRRRFFEAAPAAGESGPPSV